MNDSQRLEMMGEILDRIQAMSSEYIVLVEGKNDLKALKALGLNVETIEVQRDGGPLKAAEAVYNMGKKAIILTDWDDKGDTLAKELSLQLSALCVPFDLSIRKELGEVCIKDIKDIESLYSLYNRLDRLRTPYK